jgi:hypothetical protein
MAGEHFARFGGTLAKRDPMLAEALATALEKVAEAADQQEEAGPAVATAQSLVEDARVAVMAPEILQAPAFKGALRVDLLLAEGGVADGDEEAAAGEPWGYQGGWAALQRVAALWAEIEPLATDGRRADAQEMLAALQVLYPDPGPPVSVLGWNPEEAEVPAQRLAGIVEEVVDANLFPGRDFARLARHLGETARTSCDAYASGEEEVGAEGVFAVFDLYHGELGGTASLFAPEEHERVMDRFGLLIGVEGDRDDGVADAGDAEEDESRIETLSPVDACGNLFETLLEIGSVLGG